MQIHSDAYLSYLISDQEKDLSRKTRAIFSRFEIAIVAGQSKVTLPENVLDVIEVSWLGKTIGVADLQDYGGSSWYKPNNLANSSEEPSYFMLANYGYKTIQFHPIPSVSIPLTGGDLNTRTGYSAAVVITCYRVADPSGDEFRLRERLLRNTIKYRAMERAYLKEGKGQDLSASKYFKKKADWIEAEFIRVYQKMPKALLSDDSAELRANRGRLPRPQLPTSGPWSF